MALCSMLRSSRDWTVACATIPPRDPEDRPQDLIVIPCRNTTLSLASLIRAAGFNPIDLGALPVYGSFSDTEDLQSVQRSAHA